MYEIYGAESGMLATVGAFRVVPESRRSSTSTLLPNLHSLAAPIALEVNNAAALLPGIGRYVGHESATRQFFGAGHHAVTKGDSMAFEVLTGAAVHADAAGLPPFPDMVWIPGGTFAMGSDKHYFQ